MSDNDGSSGVGRCEAQWLTQADTATLAGGLHRYLNAIRRTHRVPDLRLLRAAAAELYARLGRGPDANRELGSPQEWLEWDAPRFVSSLPLGESSVVSNGASSTALPRAGPRAARTAGRAESKQEIHER